MTVVASKSRCKLQFQSDNLETMGYSVEYIISCLKASAIRYLQSTNTMPLEIKFGDHIPLQWFCDLVKLFEVQVLHLKELVLKLEFLSKEFRESEGDFLTHIQAKIPSKLSDDGKMLESGLQSLTKMSKRCYKNTLLASEYKCRLAEGLNFMCRLFCLHFHLGVHEHKSILNVFTIPDRLLPEAVPKYLLNSARFLCGLGSPSSDESFSSEFSSILDILYKKLKDGSLFKHSV